MFKVRFFKSFLAYIRADSSDKSHLARKRLDHPRTASHCYAQLIAAGPLAHLRGPVIYHYLLRVGKHDSPQAETLRHMDIETEWHKYGRRHLERARAINDHLPYLCQSSLDCFDPPQYTMERLTSDFR